MKKLIIHNIGPVKHVVLDLQRVNAIIGPQSAGKSCILKLACFCAWLEKQNELLQGKYITEEEHFWQESLFDFHKINGFVKSGNGAFFSYSSSSMSFSYDFDNNKFVFGWKQAGRWKYRRSRISYIPAERNIVGAVPNWLDVDLQENYIKSFIVDWSKARQNYVSNQQLPILNLGVGYYYDESRGKDMVDIGDGNPLAFSESSSGLQSLIPMWVYLDYLFDKQYTQKPLSSINAGSENDFVLMNIYATKFKKGVQAKVKSGEAHYEKIGNARLPFVSEESAMDCKRLFDVYTKTAYSDIYLEEPEQNLFPQTQVEMMYDLLRRSSKRGDNIFIATHSPYILYALNNCMMGYLAKDKIPEGAMRKNEASWINPRDVAVWELRDGQLSTSADCVNNTLQDESGLIRGNYFDRIMHNVMADFTNYATSTRSVG